MAIFPVKVAVGLNLKGFGRKYFICLLGVFFFVPKNLFHQKILKT
jgi:hypothetical protein